MGKVIAVVNQKGGVGKSTTAINLAAALRELDKRVLIIDNDPQGNTTTGFGIDKDGLYKCTYNVLVEGTPAKDVVVDINGISLIPATINLAGAEIEMVSFLSREFRLKNAIRDLVPHYDYVLIDCPPSLGLLTVNALAAAERIIIPIQCEYYALEGLTQLLETVELVKSNINPTLAIEGVLLTMYDPRTNLAIQVADEVKKYFPGLVFETIIPRNVRISEAPSFGLSVLEYASDSKGAIAYRELAQEVLQHEQTGSR
jgi:chromosome partitioning protein